MTVETSGFTGEGFAPFPNTYEDNKHIGEVSEWDTQRISRMVYEYCEFLDRDDIQPRARRMAERVLLHLGFELDYLHGAYNEVLGDRDE